MNNHRKIAIVAGVLLIVAWMTGAVCMGLIGSVLKSPDYMLQVALNPNPIMIGALLYFVMAVACAGIAISLYPVVTKFNPGLAIGSVGFRVMEGGIYLVGVVSLLSLVIVSQEFVKAGAPGAAALQASGGLVLAVNEQVSVVGMAAFSLGALMYYYVFYQARLSPRWLAGWGLVGAILALTASLMVMLGFISSSSTPQTVAYLPIGLQELVWGVWLIVKGFDPAAIASIAVETDQQ